MPGAATLKDCKTLENIVKKQAAEGRLYAAICAAPAVALGSWGLLIGKMVKVQTIIKFPELVFSIFFILLRSFNI